MNKKKGRMIIAAILLIFVFQGFYVKNVSAAPKVKISEKSITIYKGKSKKIKATVVAGKSVSKKVN